MPATPVNYTHTLGASVAAGTYEAVARAAARAGLTRSAFIRLVLEREAAREMAAEPAASALEAR